MGAANKMSKLKSKGYYGLNNYNQYELYSKAEDAIRWRNMLAFLSAVLAFLFFGVCALHSYERSQAEQQVRRANDRVLLMVEQLKAPTHADSE